MVDSWASATLKRRNKIEELEADAQAARETNKDFLALPPPAYPLSVANQQALVAQVVALTRQNNTIIRLLVDDLTEGA